MELILWEVPSPQGTKRATVNRGHIGLTKADLG